MADIVVLGGGFSGFIAAEKLALGLGSGHRVFLISGNADFTFYPSLVQLAFGKCGQEEISFDLERKLSGFGVRFIKGEISGLNLRQKRIALREDSREEEIRYDYLLIACGRKLAVEKIPGFSEYADHPLNKAAALRLAEKLRDFRSGNAVFGLCPGARLPVPACEAAFALAGSLKSRPWEPMAKISLIFPESIEAAFGGAAISRQLRESFKKNRIAIVPDFKISHIKADRIISEEDKFLPYDLLMLIPPFRGHDFIIDSGIGDKDGFIPADSRMRVSGLSGVYAAGDAAAFHGPKFGRMALRQAAVAAENIISEASGKEPLREYEHEIAPVVDMGAKDLVYLRY